ncbi:chemotaxis protein CheB, partial [Pseudomonas sp. ER28]|uniref:chemotaxis protein CheB n=1 Tax=Pseudomonas sp. ER28 TaxID=3033801 RepID=UPI0023DF353A
MNGVRAVVIGASAGGVAALFQVLGTLPSAFAIPVLCVLHLPDDRHSQLAGVMQRRLHRPVCEARDKERIRSGQIYVAGPGYHLSVERDLTLSLSQEEPVHFSRPAIDFLFISAADAYGDGLLGVLRTGANEDG